MGIVYRALQLSLKRTVAVKMIQQGPHAAPGLLQRFRREAEAVARLQHPNIVQIYEINQYKGSPYFTLELVEGGSLEQRIAGKPRPGRESAQLVESLARAMHYAHERGVVHRDLKPANVLLSSSGLPKITDFGLAKQLDADMGQTQTGAIIGTPSYMSPEQAAGKTRAIGPLTDVYSLGAILYALITGVPPFHGDSKWNTVQQVVSQDPVTPSRLQPRVHRDLETVCLKALAKDPARRYGSALELAEDLARFLAGDAILARREGFAARAWRNIRRNPVVTAAAITIVLAVTIAGVLAPMTMRRARTIAMFRNEIEAGLASPELTEEYLDRMKSRIAELDRLVPESPSNQPRLLDRFAETIREKFRGRFDEDEMPRIESAIGTLARHDSVLAERVKSEYNDRLSRWQPVFDLAAPFDNLSEIFDLAVAPVEPTGQDLLDSKGPIDMAMKQDCLVDCRLEAVFGGTWLRVAELGLILNAHENQKYLFRVTVDYSALPKDEQGNPCRPNFDEYRKRGGGIRVQILRNDELLREQYLSATQVMQDDETLHLAAAREGERLTFQVNHSEGVEFRDVLPLSTATPGVFGLHWQSGAQLKSLRAEHRPRPRQRSPLEQGDEHFNKGEFDLAARYFEQAALNGKDDRVREESMYKLGLCFRATKRHQDAIGAFAAVQRQSSQRITPPSTDWAALADIQRLLIHLSRGDPANKKAANDILDKLAMEVDEDMLSELIAESDRQVLGSRPIRLSDYVFLPTSELVRDRERHFTLRKLITKDRVVRSWATIDLFKAYWFAGDVSNAINAAELAMQSGNLLDAAGLESYCWLLCQNGMAQSALTRLDNALRESKDPRDYWLYVQRARTNVTLGELKEAEKDLDQFFRIQDKSKDLSYAHHSAACLLLGFIRLLDGDETGAMEAWRRERSQSWRPTVPITGLLTVDWAGGGQGRMQRIILASLTGNFDDGEAQDHLGWIGRQLGVDTRAALLFQKLGTSPYVICEMWNTERGRKWAKSYAFRDLSYAQFVETPLYLFGSELFHQDTMPGPLSVEQDQVIWDFVRDLHIALKEDRIRLSQIMAMGMAWHSPTVSAEGWRSSVNQLDQKLRGPASYLLAQRSMNIFKSPERAAGLFQVAWENVVADSVLGKLITAELDRLQRE
jgi:tetratricopeptide (TPR) repeat protein